MTNCCKFRVFLCALLAVMFCFFQKTKGQTNQLVRNGQTTTPITIGSGCSYNWTNSNPSIGLPASGSGNIPSFTARNAGGAPVTATITATPVASGFAYITNETSNNVSVISTATHSVVATIPTGKTPMGEALSPDGNILYIANANDSGAGPAVNGTLSVINTINNTLIATIPLDETPFSVAVSADGKRVYVSNSNSGTISVIDAANNTVISKIIADTPTAIAVSPDGKWLYYTCNHSSNLVVYFVDLSTGSAVASIPTDSYCPQIVVSPDGSKIYISLRDQGKVMVVNAITYAFIAYIPIAGDCYGLAMSPDGSRLYATSPGGKNVSVINTATNTVIGTIQTDGNPYGISVDPNGKEVYVANQNPSGVSIINTSTNQIVSRTTAGTDPIALGSFVSAERNCNGSPITVTIIVNPTPPPPPPPSITYQTPQVYRVSTPIAPLPPTNTGGAVPATIYGETSVLAGSGHFGTTDGPGATAEFVEPYGITVDAAGNIYLAEAANERVRKITPDGLVTTIAPDAIPGTPYTSGPAQKFNILHGIAVDAQGNLFVEDYHNNNIRKITPDGTVTTFAGDGSGNRNDGQGTAAGIKNPTGIVIDAAGNLYVSDGNNLIRKISPSGYVSTFVGSGAAGSADGQYNTASFNEPGGMAIDANGNIFVCDSKNNTIRKITPNGVVTTIAGNGVFGLKDGTGAAANFAYPTGITIDKSGNLYVADWGNDVIRKITPAGVVTTVAGGGPRGVNTGPGPDVSFILPAGITIDPEGNLLVAELNNDMIKKVLATGYIIDKALPPGLIFDPKTGIITGTPTTPWPSTDYTVTAYNAGGSSATIVNITVLSSVPVIQPPAIKYDTPQVYTVTTPISPLTPTNLGGPVSDTWQATVFAGSGAKGSANGPGIAASFNFPTGVATDAAGNVYVADRDNNLIRKITTVAVVSTFAGSGSGGSSNGQGLAASFNGPSGIATDASGNLFIADTYNSLIRKITPAGVVSLYAGTGVPGDSDGPAATAQIGSPVGIATDGSGNLYIAQFGNKIRKINTGKIVSTIAGSGAQGSQDGTGTSATFYTPDGIAAGPGGNLYVADEGNNLLRKIDPANTVTTIAGKGQLTTFTSNYGVATDAAGNIYGTDAGNQRVYKIDALGNLTTLVNNLGVYPIGIAVDPFGNIYVADPGQHQIYKIGASGYFIDKPLPAGLTFDSNTGIISGTPTQPSSSTDYIITAYNAAGVSAFKINITVKDVTTPPNITYPTPQVYTRKQTITPLSPTNTGGTVQTPSGYAINKTLPEGLTFDAQTGIISGTPAKVSPSTDYTITATNAGGESSFTINITVIKPDPLIQTITFNPLPAKTYGDPDFNPGATTTNSAIPITYSSDNTAVTTVINGKLHITGVGTTNITASQDGDDDYSPATPVTQQLTVKQAPLTIRADDKTRDFQTPNPEFTFTYTGFVYNEGPAQLTELPTGSTAATINSAVGQYVITVNGGDSPNYDITRLNGTLNVIPSLASITIPNTFTPNGDGINDTWNIPMLAYFPQCLVSIYTRYGSMVYQSRGYNTPWAGTHKNSPVPVGTYYYIINPSDGSKQLSGYIAIIR